MDTIRKASPEDCAVISQLIHQIYPITYRGILSAAQIDFMLEKSYTVSALGKAIGEGQDFFILYEREVALGFIALLVQGDVLRVEKLYLLLSCQGKGFGQKLLLFAEARAREHRLSFLELNVNRGNAAYGFYLKQGFETVKEVDIPYYGFVLDDYVMRKRLR